MAADLEYVRNVSLSSGTSTYITLDLSGMSAYKDAVIFFQGFLSGNDNDGSSVRLQAYTASGWQQSYNSSSYIFNNHNATSTTYHNNNNPGMQLNGKWTTHQTLYGWAQTGGMGCMMIEIMNFSASGSRAPIVQFQTGTPSSRNDSNQAHQYETTLGMCSLGHSSGSYNGAWSYARLYTDGHSWRSPSIAHIYGRKFD